MNKEKLRSKLALQALTARKLSGLVGISLNSMSNKINGNRVFSQDEIQKIINILGLTPEETTEIFFDRKEVENDSPH